MQNTVLYLITALIWGSTWLAIKFQLGVVAPELSVAYRFALAAILLFIYSAVRGLPMRFTIRQHGRIALQALFLFSFNYFLIYQAEGHLTSGLVAILATLNTIGNAILGAIFLGVPIRRRVVFGSILGILGVGIIFYPELSSFGFSGGGGLGLILMLISVTLSSAGDTLSASNQREKLPVIQTNAYGMIYGALFMFILTAVNGTPITFDFSFSYLTSLLFLALFGSVIAFGAYLTLVGRIGADKAAYVSVLFPIVSLTLSVLFEGMMLNNYQIVGMVLALVGNAIVLVKIKPKRKPVAVASAN
jgi:drug/metabolite transporter (DMT)-like permease